MTAPIIYLHDLGIVCALGRGKDAVFAGLMRGDTSGMRLEPDWHPRKSMRVGRVADALPAVALSLERYRCRTSELLLAAAQEIAPAIDVAVRRYGRGRIGVVIGTSTSGIAAGEAAIAALDTTGEYPPAFHYLQQEMGMPSRFLAEVFGIEGPAYVVSTACTSGAKALASARFLLAAGLCDAVIAGGVDSLCRLTLYGFTALELTTPDLCNPMSANRKGINIGEGAALFLVSTERGSVALRGIGESSDAYHISAPDPSGGGAQAAMRSALLDAGIAAEDVNYVNLHGTGTLQNDGMEVVAVAGVFGASVPCSSTKPLTGHALGAAGAIEAGFCWLLLSRYNAARTVPPHVWDAAADPELPRLALADQTAYLPAGRVAIAASNSFAFGGNNISLVLSECP